MIASFTANWSRNLSRGDSFEIGLGHGNLAAEACVLARVGQFGTIFRIGMQSRLDAGPVSLLPVVVLIGPNRELFHYQSFAVGIEFVGHRLAGGSDCGVLIGEKSQYNAKNLVGQWTGTGV